MPIWMIFQNSVTHVNFEEFKWKHKKSAESAMSGPFGLLSEVPAETIIEANNEKLKAITNQSAPKNKGPYIKTQCKAKIAKYALEHVW